MERRTKRHRPLTDVSGTNIPTIWTPINQIQTPLHAALRRFAFARHQNRDGILVLSDLVRPTLEALEFDTMDILDQQALLRADIVQIGNEKWVLVYCSRLGSLHFFEFTPGVNSGHVNNNSLKQFLKAGEQVTAFRHCTDQSFAIGTDFSRTLILELEVSHLEISKPYVEELVDFSGRSKDGLLDAFVGMFVRQVDNVSDPVVALSGVGTRFSPLISATSKRLAICILEKREMQADVINLDKHLPSGFNQCTHMTVTPNYVFLVSSSSTETRCFSLRIVRSRQSEIDVYQLEFMYDCKLPFLQHRRPMNLVAVESASTKTAVCIIEYSEYIYQVSVGGYRSHLMAEISRPRDCIAVLCLGDRLVYAVNEAVDSKEDQEEMYLAGVPQVEDSNEPDRVVRQLQATQDLQVVLLGAFQLWKDGAEDSSQQVLEYLSNYLEDEARAIAVICETAERLVNAIPFVRPMKFGVESSISNSLVQKKPTLESYIDFIQSVILTEDNEMKFQILKAFSQFKECVDIALYIEDYVSNLKDKEFIERHMKNCLRDRGVDRIVQDEKLSTLFVFLGQTLSIADVLKIPISQDDNLMQNRLVIETIMEAIRYRSVNELPLKEDKILFNPETVELLKKRVSHCERSLTVRDDEIGDRYYIQLTDFGNILVSLDMREGAKQLTQSLVEHWIPAIASDDIIWGYICENRFWNEFVQFAFKVEELVGGDVVSIVESHHGLSEEKEVPRFLIQELISRKRFNLIVRHELNSAIRSFIETENPSDKDVWWAYFLSIDDETGGNQSLKRLTDNCVGSLEDQTLFSSLGFLSSYACSDDVLAKEFENSMRLIDISKFVFGENANGIRTRDKYALIQELRSNLDASSSVVVSNVLFLLKLLYGESNIDGTWFEEMRLLWQYALTQEQELWNMISQKIGSDRVEQIRYEDVKNLLLFQVICHCIEDYEKDGFGKIVKYVTETQNLRRPWLFDRVIQLAADSILTR